MFKIENLTFTYNSTSIAAIKNLNLQLIKGQIVALVGSSGSGKSTLLRLIAGLAPGFYSGKKTGKIYLTEDCEINQLSAKERISNIGFVFSDPYAQLSNLCDTVEEEIAWGLCNIALPVEEIRERVEFVLDALYMKDLRYADPNSLSLGQAQKLAVASVLAFKPHILLLDEPSSSLDPQSQEELWELIGKLVTPQTLVIWATSKFSEAKRCANWIVIDSGKLLYCGPAIQDFIEEPPKVEWGPLPCLWPAVFSTVKKYPESDPSFLEIEDLSFAYANNNKILENFHAKFSTPQCVAIRGKNGVGKTTLARLLAGILRPQKGSIKVKGQEITTLPLHLVAPLVSFIPADARKEILSSTVKEEIAFAPRCQGHQPEEIEKTVKDLLKLTELDEHVNSNPYELSTCNLYLLSIAAVLALKAPVVIFDEPTLHADLPFMRAFLNIIEYLLERGTLVIIISHDQELIDLTCHQTILLG